MNSTFVSKVFGNSSRKSSFYLSIFSVTGAAAVTYHHTVNPYSHPDRHSSLYYIATSLNGVIRSSRSLYTITANVIDYKYSLQGLSPDTDQYRRTLSEVHIRSAKRILKLCEINRGFYIKAGQFVASLRQVPKEYSSTLASLQDQVQYPRLKDRMKMDIATMSVLAKCVSWFFPEYRFQWMVSEFSEVIALELDFIQEAKNSVRTAMNFKHNSKIRIPMVFQELTTSQVLTMQYCRGRRVDDLEFIQEMGINPRKVGNILVEAFAEMIFVHGFVHGDPHPGNIMVSSDDKEGFCLVLLDHGIYRSLDDEFRVNYCQLWKALILLDTHKIQQIGEHFGIGKYAKFLPLIFTGRTINSKASLGNGMSVEEKTNLKQEMKSLSMGDISEFMESLPSEFLTVLRTDALIRSLTSKLGLSQRKRLLVYANFALDGLSTMPDPNSDFVLKALFTRIKSGVNHLQIRLLLGLIQLFSWMGDMKGALMIWSKEVTFLISQFVIREYSVHRLHL